MASSDLDRLKKPGPGAKINHSHPLTRGLIGCYLYNQAFNRHISMDDGSAIEVGRYDSFYKWNRKLSEDEIKSLENDPYQIFLKPGEKPERWWKRWWRKMKRAVSKLLRL